MVPSEHVRVVGEKQPACIATATATQMWHRIARAPRNSAMVAPYWSSVVIFVRCFSTASRRAFSV